MTENALVQIIEQSGIDKLQAKPLLENFGDFFVKAHKLSVKAKGIKVTSVDQVEEMKQAREIRIELKNLRVDADKTRVKLKEGYLRGGNAVQAIYNDIHKIVKPAEEYLENQEKFAQIQEQKRLAERYQKRLEKITPYVSPEVLQAYDLMNTSDEIFETILSDSKKKHEEKIEAEKKAEEERLELEKKQNLLLDRRVEIAPYMDFVSKDFDLRVDTDEKTYKKALEEAKKAKSEHQKEQERIRKENEELAKKAREAEKKLELEEKKKADAQRQEEERTKKEQEQRAELEAAPDKRKLVVFADMLAALEYPLLKTKTAQKTLSEIKNLINQAEKKARGL